MKVFKCRINRTAQNVRRSAKGGDKTSSIVKTTGDGSESEVTDRKS